MFKSVKQILLMTALLLTALSLFSQTPVPAPGITVKEDGKVGINTGTPARDLEVNGNVQIDQGLYINGNTSVSGRLDATGDITTKGKLTVNDDITSGGDVKVSGGDIIDTHDKSRIQFDTANTSLNLKDANNKIRIEIKDNGVVNFMKWDGTVALILDINGNIEIVNDVKVSGRDIRDENDKARITFTEDGKMELNDTSEVSRINIETDQSDHPQVTVNSKLQVMDRIYDKSGILVPVGTIVAFYGKPEDIPDGWVLCDGRSISASKYYDLQQLLKSLYAPDLRGMFLRAVDDPDGSGGTPAAGNDPDAANRKDSAGNSVGGIIGSRQSDAFQSHIHNSRRGSVINMTRGDTGVESYWGSGEYYATSMPLPDGTNGDPRTSNETRPKNVYVNYIIKY